MMTYPTDLSDAESGHIEPHLPAANQRGRPKVHRPREILKAVFFYVLTSGCPWRLWPREFSPWRRPEARGAGPQRKGARRRRGIRLLLEPLGGRFARLSHLWVDACYRGGARGGLRKRWA
jgi:transposase